MKSKQKEFLRVFVNCFPFTVRYVITSVTDQNMELIGWRRIILMAKPLLKKTITPKGYQNLSKNFMEILVQYLQKHILLMSVFKICEGILVCQGFFPKSVQVSKIFLFLVEYPFTCLKNLLLKDVNKTFSYFLGAKVFSLFSYSFMFQTLKCAKFFLYSFIARLLSI
jgi:hypothetical protein